MSLSQNLLYAPLILASASPQRAEILRDFGFSFTICPADIEEVIDPDISPKQVAQSLAEQKADALGAQEGKIIIAADTIGVSPSEKILCKAQSREEAEMMLREKSGKSEQVITGFCLLSPEKKVCGVEVSTLFYHGISEELLTQILDSGEWKGVAGSLRMEGKYMRRMIDRYEGDFYSILGLPIGRITELLRSFPLEIQGA